MTVSLSGGTYDNINSLCFLDGAFYGLDTQDIGSFSSLQNLVRIDVVTGAITTIAPAPTGCDALVGNVPVVPLAP